MVDTGVLVTISSIEPERSHIGRRSREALLGVMISTCGLTPGGVAMYSALLLGGAANWILTPTHAGDLSQHFCWKTVSASRNW